jgi:hypothetical protein
MKGMVWQLKRSLEATTMEDGGTDEKVMRLCRSFCLRIRRGIRGGGDPRKVPFARGTSWRVQLPSSDGLEVR